MKKILTIIGIIVLLSSMVIAQEDESSSFGWNLFDWLSSASDAGVVVPIGGNDYDCKYSGSGKTSDKNGDGVISVKCTDSAVGSGDACQFYLFDTKRRTLGEARVLKGQSSTISCGGYCGADIFLDYVVNSCESQGASSGTDGGTGGGSSDTCLAEGTTFENGKFYCTQDGKKIYQCIGNSLEVSSICASGTECQAGESGSGGVDIYCTSQELDCPLGQNARGECLVGLGESCTSDLQCANFNSVCSSGKCKALECTEPTYRDCSDGSRIVDKDCQDGEYVQLDFLCPEQEEENIEEQKAIPYCCYLQQESDEYGYQCLSVRECEDGKGFIAHDDQCAFREVGSCTGGDYFEKNPEVVDPQDYSDSPSNVATENQECVEDGEVFYTNVKFSGSQGYLILLSKTWSGKVSSADLLEVGKLIPNFADRFRFTKEGACCTELKEKYVDSRKEGNTNLIAFGLLGHDITSADYDIYECVPEGQGAEAEEFGNFLKSVSRFVGFGDSVLAGVIIILVLITFFVFILGKIGGK